MFFLLIEIQGGM